MPGPLDRDLSAILEETGNLWEGLRGARVFLTGGTGFVGCWLLESFIAANQRLKLGAGITVLTRDERSFRHQWPSLAEAPGICLHVGDVRDFDEPQGRVTHVIHAAAEMRSRTDPSKSTDTEAAIVNGARRTIEFAVRAGAADFLLVSSGAVYGNQPEGVSCVGEEHPQTPDSGSAYAQAKRKAELLCKQPLAGPLRAKVARCFTFSGPYMPAGAGYAVTDFISDALAGRPIRVRGDGTPVRSYLYAADMAAWLWTILLRGTAGRAYNVGSEEAVSTAELARETAALLSPGSLVEVAGKAVPGRGTGRYVPSTLRARTELGLRQTVDRGQAILRTAAWYKAVGWA